MEELEQTQEDRKNNAGEAEELQRKYDELLNATKHLAADFDNFRKRTESEHESEKKSVTRELIIKLLPIVDMLLLCLEHTDHHEEFVKGVKLISGQILSLLEVCGVHQINALHEKFDPKLHEAVMYISSDSEENIVIGELQKGYVMDENVLRTSKVKVGKKVINNPEG